MLSGETAAVDFPVESVQTMNRIALKTESRLDHALILKKRSQKTSMTITDAISQSVTHTAANLGVSAIITPTQSGHSARMVAKYRPESPRSEEHTSELQSRGHLVCRRPLEKKNQND